jgi:hypothetical protein
MEQQFRLLVDLSTYHPAFVRGAVGTAAPKWPPPYGYHDGFFTFRLSTGEKLPVLWDSVEAVEAVSHA